jgi:hypothetical protein
VLVVAGFVVTIVCVVVTVVVVTVEVTAVGVVVVTGGAEVDAKVVVVAMVVLPPEIPLNALFWIPLNALFWTMCIKLSMASS